MKKSYVLTLSLGALIIGATASGLVVKIGQTSQSPPDSFDDELAQPPRMYDPGLDTSEMYQAKGAELNRALLEILKNPKLLAIREDSKIALIKGKRVRVWLNTGTEVNKYIRYCGLKPPQKWCAAFVCYQINEGVKTVNETKPKPKQVKNFWPKYASCDDLYYWGERHGIVDSTPQGFPCVFLIRKKAGSNDFVHTGFVVGKQGNKLITVEGNANQGQSNNGNGVYRLASRTLNTAKMQFIQIP